MAADAPASPLAALPAVSLAGVWAFRAGAPDPNNLLTATTEPVRAGEDGWTAATVPGCWERDGQNGTLLGPVWYRRDVPAPPGSGRLWWECDAVSYHCEGYVNGRRVGAHTGMWDAFAWEVPPDARTPDGLLRLALSVEKPGGKQFPVRETLAGFLPYVWGTWGGPWQETRLRWTGATRIESVWATGSAGGALDAEAEVNVAFAPALLRFTLRDPSGKPVTALDVPAPESGVVKAKMTVRGGVERWETDRPVHYTLTVDALVNGRVSDSRARRVGFRDVRVRGESVFVNDRPVLFRAPLSWGWYEETRAPNPPAEVFRKELEQVRALGFNGMKLCLWVPPPSYFDIADQMGMLLWVELPLWLPEATPFSREQTPKEYRRIVRQVGDHPSVLLWTVGCEIGKGVDAGFLRGLYDIVKAQTGSPLVRDNSGSAECYGGPLPESADFRDYHLYADLPQSRTTFDAFAPDWRERQPFFFGEFNDQDAFRDLPALTKKRENKPPWWAVADPKRNPKGVRWEYGVTGQVARMKEAGLLERADELRESARKQALLARKVTLELARSLPHLSGYVVTGLADTPIATAGLFDDFGSPRFTPEEFRPFNGDAVLFVEADRRRAWTSGGDRPAYLDRWGVWGGETVRRHVGVSYYGTKAGQAGLTWTAAAGPGDGAATQGGLRLETLRPGDVRELGPVEFPAPNVTRPERLILAATLELPDGGRAVNAWPVWVYPKPTKDASRRVGLYDPGSHLGGFADATGLTPVPLASADGTPTDGKGPVPLLVTTAWRATMPDYVRSGGRLLLVQPAASAEATGDGLPAAALPFFREAMRLFEPHPSWGRFPHEKTTDLCFYGLASDCAFETEKVRAALGEGTVLEPVLTRVDARSFAVHAYTLSVRLGAGRMLLTTLRPQGGLGDQPSGLARHPAGAFLLREWLDWLGDE